MFSKGRFIFQTDLLLTLQNEIYKINVLFLLIKLIINWQFWFNPRFLNKNYILFFYRKLSWQIDKSIHYVLQRLSHLIGTGCLQFPSGICFLGSMANICRPSGVCCCLIGWLIGWFCFSHSFMVDSHSLVTVEYLSSVEYTLPSMKGEHS